MCFEKNSCLFQTYDAEADFQRMVAAGVFQSIRVIQEAEGGAEEAEGGAEEADE